jgi:hypothetical protein
MPHEEPSSGAAHLRSGPAPSPSRIIKLEIIGGSFDAHSIAAGSTDSAQGLAGLRCSGSCGPISIRCFPRGRHGVRARERTSITHPEASIGPSAIEIFSSTPKECKPHRDRCMTIAKRAALEEPPFMLSCTGGSGGESRCNPAQRPSAVLVPRRVSQANIARLGSTVNPILVARRICHASLQLARVRCSLGKECGGKACSGR